MRALLKGSLDKSQTLKRDSTLTYCQTDSLGIIYPSGWHSPVLISNILDLAKISAHRLEIHLTDSYWRTFLNVIVVNTKVQAIERSLCLQLKYSPNLATRICAAEKIPREVSSHVFDKVVKFTEHSQVTLRVCSECLCLGVPVERLPIESSKLMLVQNLCFEVSDTGISMMQVQLEKILQPFNLQPFKQFRSTQPQFAEIGVELASEQQGVELTVSKLKTISRWSKELRFWSEGLRKLVTPLASFISCLAQPFCAPHVKKAESLYKLTLLGNTQNIQDRASYPKHQNDRYLPFVSKIEDSVQKLPERAIPTLVESYLYLERSL